MIISLMSENRGNKTRFHGRPYRLSSASVFFKCDEMSLRWVFTVKTAVILLNGIFEFVFNSAINFKQDKARWRKF